MTDTKTLVKQDLIDNVRKQIKPKGMLAGDECVVTRCKVKEDNKLLEEKVETIKTESFRMRKEIEAFHDSFEKELDGPEKEELIIKAMKSREVQTQHKMVVELKETNENLQDALKAVVQEFDESKKDQDRIMTNFEADRKIQEKVKIIKSLRDKHDQLIIQNDNLEITIDKANLHYQHLADTHNNLLAEYKTLRKKVQQLKMIDKDGFKLKPLKDKVANVSKKRNWSLKRFIARN